MTTELGAQDRWFWTPFFPVVVALGIVALALAPSGARPAEARRHGRTPTFEERAAAQKAIEQVYWNHRIWPKENPAPEPPHSKVMTDTVIRARSPLGLGMNQSASRLLPEATGNPQGCATFTRDADRVAADPGAPAAEQSIAAAIHASGNADVSVGGLSSFEIDGARPGLNQPTVRVESTLAPSTDNCSSPTPLPLDRIVFGTTEGAANDYRSPGACFTGLGQIATSSDGLDVVFSFTPPDTDVYSFRYVQDDASAALRNQNPVLYLANNCPAPNPSSAIGGCVKGANRTDNQTTGNDNLSEEINCVPLTGGTPYYLFFDDKFLNNPGGPFALEVTRCRAETEPNGTTATASPYAPNSGCFMEGASSTSGPAGDIDFYALGTPPNGSKIFAAVDAAASNNSDYELRITGVADTYGYDDDDGTTWVGSNAPIVAGVIAPGGSPLYVRVNSKPPSISGNEPYLLFARVETGAAQDESLPDPPPAGVVSNDTVYGATHLTGGGFVKGSIYGWDPVIGPDQDCFRFVARKGDQIVAFSDNNPTRVAGTITNVWPVLKTIDGDLRPWNKRFVGQTLRNLGLPGPSQGLTSVTPSVTSEFMHYRARYDGAYTICYAPTQDINGTENPPPNAYPLGWQGSISINCGAVPGGPFFADIGVTMMGPAGEVRSGSIVNYVITLTNNGADIAQDVRLVDNLPPELVYVGLSANDGFGGYDTGCLTLPTAGQNDATVDCTNYSIAPGATVTYTLSVQVANCIGAGRSVVNSASITAYTVDSNQTNNTASTAFVTSEDGTCQDLLCDPFRCFFNACTINDHCDASGSCVGNPLECDDHSVCTVDSCDPGVGNCIHDSSQLVCFDGNDCTFDTCDPVVSCQFPPKPSGTTCNDYLNCTLNDACDGFGHCIAHNVCDDGLPCTDDFADEANNCSCVSNVSFQGTPCHGPNLCLSGSTCDGVGGTAAHCSDPTGPTNCDDNNPCTNDSCVPATGCIHTANSNACSDGTACTTGEVCGGGICHSGTPVICTDNNVCTTDSCDPVTGCVYTNNTNPCGDGSSCTTGDTCSNGSCGTTVADDTSCHDGHSCTVGETCRSGNCLVPVALSQPTGSPVSVGANTNPYALASGDFSGDGRLDLAVANNGTGRVSILIGNGAGGFTQPAGPFTAEAEPVAIVAGYWNADQLLDLAVADYYGANHVTLFQNNGAGGFNSASVTVGTNPRSIVTGDWNGDGKADLAVANSGSNNVTILLGTGSGSFTSAAGSPVLVGDLPGCIAAGDLNGDGKPDLVVANGNSDSVTILLGNGSGGFVQAPGSPLTGIPGPVSLAVGDFSRDGNLDLAVANYTPGTVTILLGNGAGGFSAAPGSPVGAGSTPFWVSVGDVNNDGRLDLAVANRGTSNSVTILLGNRSGGFASAGGSPFTVGANDHFVTLADFNRDGRLDLASANFDANSVSILMNNDIIAPDGRSCDDGSFCTTSDTCYSGVCGGPSVCNAQCTMPPSGLTSWWPAEGIANDIRPSGNHGTLTNGAAFATGEVGQAFSLDGIDDYVRVPHSTMLDPGTASFTLAAWIRTSATANTQIIFSKYECGGSCPSGSANSAYTLYLSASGALHLDLRDTDGPVFQSLSGPNSLADGAWHHVAGTRDMATASINLYADGALVASSSLSSGANGRIGEDDGEPDPLIVGAQFIGGTNTLQSFFSGRIDEAMYFNRAVTASELQAIATAGSVGPCRCTDADGDGYGAQGRASCPHGTQQDCNDGIGNGGVWSPPIDVQSLQLSGHATTSLTWTDQSALVGPSVTYDLLRGAVGSQVGTGVETCVGSPWSSASATDNSIPSPGTGYRYLVRGHNICGAGKYGNQGVKGARGAQRSSTGCP